MMKSPNWVNSKYFGKTKETIKDYQRHLKFWRNFVESGAKPHCLHFQVHVVLALTEAEVMCFMEYEIFICLRVGLFNR